MEQEHLDKPTIELTIVAAFLHDVGLWQKEWWKVANIHEEESKKFVTTSPDVIRLFSSEERNIIQGLIEYTKFFGDENTPQAIEKRVGFSGSLLLAGRLLGIGDTLSVYTRCDVLARVEGLWHEFKADGRVENIPFKTAQDFSAGSYDFLLNYIEPRYFAFGDVYAMPALKEYRQLLESNKKILYAHKNLISSEKNTGSSPVTGLGCHAIFIKAVKTHVKEHLSPDLSALFRIMCKWDKAVLYGKLTIEDVGFFFNIFVNKSNTKAELEDKLREGIEWILSGRMERLEKKSSETSGSNPVSSPVDRGRGLLDGRTILRFSLTYHDVGGIDIQLQQLNRALLEKNEMTIIQAYFTEDRAGLEAIEQSIGRGKLVEVPVLSLAPRRSGSSKIGRVYNVMMNLFARSGLRIFMRDWISLFMRVPLIRSLDNRKFNPEGLLVAAKKIFNKYNVDLVVIHGMRSQDALALAKTAKQNKVPIVCENPENNRNLYNSIARRLISLADRLVVLTDVAVPGFARSNFSVGYNGIDTAFFSPVLPQAGLKARLKLPDVPIVILPARLNGRKGHRDAVYMANYLKGKRIKAHFAFVGPADSKEAKKGIVSLVNKYGLQEEIGFIGSVSQEAIRNYYAVGDIVILPSESEGFGGVLLEAQAMEKPVITYDAGGTPVTMIDGQTGYLIKSRDIRAFSGRLAQLLLDRELRLSMGRNGRRFVEGKFSLQAFANRHEQIYADVINMDNRDRPNCAVSVSNAIAAAMILLIISPFILLLSLIVKLNFQGESILYKAKRVGLGQRFFMMYKFRRASDKVKEPEIPDMKNTSFLIRLIDRTRLNELPQLLNIAKGEMAFVGPRASSEFQYDNFSKVRGFKAKARVKPGLTSLTKLIQLVNDDDVHISNDPGYLLGRLENEYKQDNWYVENKSIKLDIIVLLMTVPVVLLRSRAKRIFYFMLDKVGYDFGSLDDSRKDGCARGSEVFIQETEEMKKGISSSPIFKSPIGEDRRPDFTVVPEELILYNKKSGESIEKNAVVSLWHSLPLEFREYHLLTPADEFSEGLVILSKRDIFSQIEGPNTKENYEVVIKGDVKDRFLESITPTKRFSYKKDDSQEALRLRLSQVSIIEELSSTEKTAISFLLTGHFDRELKLSFESIGPVLNIKRTRVDCIRLGDLGPGQYRRSTWAELQEAIELYGDKTFVSAGLTEDQMAAVKGEDVDRGVIDYLVKDEKFLKDTFHKIFARPDLEPGDISFYDIVYRGQGGFKRVYQVTLRMKERNETLSFVIKVVQSDVVRSDSDYTYDENYAQKIVNTASQVREYDLFIYPAVGGFYIVRDSTGQKRIIFTEAYVVASGGSAKLDTKRRHGIMLQTYLKYYNIFGGKLFLWDPKPANIIVRKRDGLGLVGTHVDLDNVIFGAIDPYKTVEDLISFGFNAQDVAEVVLKEMRSDLLDEFIAGVRFGLRLYYRYRDTSNIDEFVRAIETRMADQSFSPKKHDIKAPINVTVNGFSHRVPQGTILIHLLEDRLVDLQTNVVRLNKKLLGWADKKPIDLKKRKNLYRSTALKDGDVVEFFPVDKISTSTSQQYINGHIETRYLKEKTEILKHKGFDKRLSDLEKGLIVFTRRISTPYIDKKEMNKRDRATRSGINQIIQGIVAYLKHYKTKPLDLDRFATVFNALKYITFKDMKVRGEVLEEYAEIRNTAEKLLDEFNAAMEMKPDEVKAEISKLVEGSDSSSSPLAKGIDKRFLANIFLQGDDYLAYTFMDIINPNNFGSSDETKEAQTKLWNNYLFIQPEWLRLQKIILDWNAKERCAKDVKIFFSKFLRLLRRSIKISAVSCGILSGKESKKLVQEAVENAKDFIRGIKMLFDEERKQVNINDSLSKMLKFIFSNYFRARVPNYDHSVVTELCLDMPKLLASPDKIAFLFLNLLLPLRERSHVALKVKTELEARNGGRFILIKLEDKAGFSLDNYLPDGIDTGVGFKLAKKIARELSGEISLSGSSKKTTAFLIRLLVRDTVSASSPVGLANDKKIWPVITAHGSSDMRIHRSRGTSLIIEEDYWTYSMTDPGIAEDIVNWLKIRGNLGPYNKFCDPFMGNGFLVDLVNAMTGAYATGFEMDRGIFDEAVKTSKELARLGVVNPKRVHLINGDSTKAKLAPYNVFYIYPPWMAGVPDPELVRSTILRMKAGAIMVLSTGIDPGRSAEKIGVIVKGKAEVYRRVGGTETASSPLTKRNLSSITLQGGAELLSSASKKELAKVSRPDENYRIKYHDGIAKLELLREKDRYPYEDTPLKLVNQRLGVDLSSRISELAMIKQRIYPHSPYVVLDLGVGSGTTINSLNWDVIGAGLKNIELYGFGDQTYDNWRKLPESITLILNDFQFFNTCFKRGSIDLIYSHYGLLYTSAGYGKVIFPYLSPGAEVWSYPDLGFVFAGSGFQEAVLNGKKYFRKPKKFHRVGGTDAASSPLANETNQTEQIVSLEEYVKQQRWLSYLDRAKGKEAWCYKMSLAQNVTVQLFNIGVK